MQIAFVVDIYGSGMITMALTRVDLLNMSTSKQAKEAPPSLLRQLEEITHIVRRLVMMIGMMIAATELKY